MRKALGAATSTVAEQESMIQALERDCQELRREIHLSRTVQPPVSLPVEYESFCVKVEPSSVSVYGDGARGGQHSTPRSPALPYVSFVVIQNVQWEIASIKVVPLAMLVSVKLYCELLSQCLWEIMVTEHRLTARWAWWCIL
jgi:hypothetical protein